MDGETLKAMKSHASFEQMKACGLKIVKDQMKFQTLLAEMDEPASQYRMSGGYISCSGSSSSSNGSPKLTIKEIKKLPAEEKRLYLIK